ncbi:MAG: CoB--CoM heterodisulfide reductase iron-sulfur subunit A family protein [Anaerolineales bacterium]|jgi:heterodisulfide reductase subunit A
MGSKRPRIGVYICHCGLNIAGTVDVEAVRAYAETLPNVVTSRRYLYSCSEPGQDMIREDIESGLINRLVVASCSPRMHEPTFRGVCVEKGLNPYYYQQANIREDCSWVHPEGEATTEKAKELVRAAVGRVARHGPLDERSVDVLGKAIVVGGGVAGLSAALKIADAGFPVTIVEKEDHLGGNAIRWFHTFPTLTDVGDMLQPLIERVTDHENITVMLNTALEKVEGYIGNFEVTLNKDGNLSTMPTGSMVVAIGYSPFDPHLKPELGYGKVKGVVSTVDVERMLREGPEKLKGIKDVVFLSCVGSRDKQVGNPYCSRVCCMVNMKQAMLLRQMLPDANITVLYIDVRAFGKGFEEFFDKVRSEKVRYRRGNVSEILPRGERLVVHAEDTMLQKPIEFEADLAILGVGMVPRPEHEMVSKLIKLPRSGDGFFMERHPKLAPVETTVDGVFIGGCCQSPKDITDTISHAQAAASGAMAPLLLGNVKVEAAVSNASPEICAGCGQCADQCPFGALVVDPRVGAIRVNPTLCKGCGSCAVVCPSNAIKCEHFRPEQILAEVDGLLFDAWE